MNCDGGGAQRATSDCTRSVGRAGQRERQRAGDQQQPDDPRQPAAHRVVRARYRRASRCRGAVMRRIVGVATHPRGGACSLQSSQWHSSTCARTPSIRWSTARCAWPMRCSAARADGQVALAITDLGNLFGAVKFYQACRAEGVKPIIGVDLWLEPGEQRRQAGHAPAAAGVQRHRLSEPVRTVVARVDGQRAARAGVGQVAMAGRLPRRPDRAVGRRQRRGRRGAAGRRSRARGGAGAAPGGASIPGRFYIELQRAGLPTHEAHVRAGGGARCGAEAAGGGHASGAVPTPEEFDAHEARVCVAEGETLANPRRIKRFTREQYFKTQAQMQALFADVPAGHRQHIAHRAALQPAAHAGHGQAARLPDARTAHRSTSISTGSATQGLERRLLALYPQEAGARQAARALRRAPGIRDHHHPQDGLLGLLPDRRRLHQLGAQQRLPGGPGARLGCRLAGGLCAGHHRPRPAALPAAVRAFPEPRARVDAGLRHRLLPGQPRARDRLREAALRPRRGEPDRHLRHDGRQGRAARRRPRARHGLRPCRFDRQADPGTARQDGDAWPRCPRSPTRA